MSNITKPVANTRKVKVFCKINDSNILLKNDSLTIKKRYLDPI